MFVFSNVIKPQGLEPLQFPTKFRSHSGRDTTMMAASRWEGEQLVAEGRQGDMQMHEVMTLSPDGSTLTISVTTTTPEGQTVNRLVYTKTQTVGPCETWAMPCKEFPEHVGPR